MAEMHVFVKVFKMGIGITEFIVNLKDLKDLLQGQGFLFGFLEMILADLDALFLLFNA